MEMASLTVPLLWLCTLGRWDKSTSVFYFPFCAYAQTQLFIIFGADALLCSFKLGLTFEPMMILDGGVQVCVISECRAPQILAYLTFSGRNMHFLSSSASTSCTLLSQSGEIDYASVSRLSRDDQEYTSHYWKYLSDSVIFNWYCCGPNCRS